MVDTMLEIDKEVYGKYVRYEKKQKKTHVCPPQQGDVRNTKGSTYVLQEVVKIAERVWVHHKPIGTLRCKQVDKRRETYCGVARRRYESDAQK